MRSAWLLLALLACRSDERAPTQAPPPTPAPAPAPTIDRDALLLGKLPDNAPELELINAQCRICHAVEYLTQQRHGEGAWKKTIDKMRKQIGEMLRAQARPNGIATSCRHTARWNSVPRGASASSNTRRRPAKYSSS